VVIGVTVGCTCEALCGEEVGVTLLKRGVSTALKRFTALKRGDQRQRWTW